MFVSIFVLLPSSFSCTWIKCTCTIWLMILIHLTKHGHHFYVLTTQKASIGWGSYSPFVDPYPPGLEPSREDHTPYNLTKATLRDTTQIPSRGYAVLRFRADNPGVWLFHCHITWHLASGMAMLVDVMGDEMGVGAHEAGMGMCLSVS